MLDRLKQSWRELKRGTPGHRFQDRAERNRRNRSSQSTSRRVITLLMGILLLTAGIILCLIPGPGLPLIAIGLALLAERSIRIARCLDWSELKLRGLLTWGNAWWRHATAAGKFAALLLATIIAASAGYGAYSIMLSR